jgi:hydroxymethylpyrimidine/phosphomethylpyrimidine kinase
VINTLYAEQGVVRRDAWDRLSGRYHGSGCTLASALAASLAFGQDVSQAVWDAQEFTYESLKAAFRPGMGQYIPGRFFWAREPNPEGSA